MTTAASLQRDHQSLRQWLSDVSTAAMTFEARWTWAALRRVDDDLHGRLTEQRSLFDAATITGTTGEVETHGAAMCRGYAAAVRAMEASQEPDDAYMLGRDPRTGLQVAIGHQKAAAERVSQAYGDDAVWLTPDEVASFLAAAQAFKPIAAVKRRFPGAEITDFSPTREASE